MPVACSTVAMPRVSAMFCAVARSVSFWYHTTFTDGNAPPEGLAAMTLVYPTDCRTPDCWAAYPLTPVALMTRTDVL